jgi:hypothetical protein
VNTKRHRGAGAGFEPLDDGETLFVGLAVQVNSGSSYGCAEFLALFDGMNDSPLRLRFAILGTKVSFGLHPDSEVCESSPSDSVVTSQLDQQVFLVVSYNKTSGAASLLSTRPVSR